MFLGSQICSRGNAKGAPRSKMYHRIYPLCRLGHATIQPCTDSIVLQTRLCSRLGRATDLVVPHIELCYRFRHTIDVVTKNVINFVWQKPTIYRDISDTILSDMIYPTCT